MYGPCFRIVIYCTGRTFLPYFSDCYLLYGPHVFAVFFGLLFIVRAALFAVFFFLFLILTWIKPGMILKNLINHNNLNVK